MLSQPPRIIICSPFGNLPARGVRIKRKIGVNRACHLGNTVYSNRITKINPMLLKPQSQKYQERTQKIHPYSLVKVTIKDSLSLYDIDY